MTRGRLWLIACAALAAGCGGGDSAANGEGPDPNDKRANALECITEEKELEARPVGDNEIQVGDEKTGPRVRFYLTGGEAEAAQFSGRAEGAEHIGSALLFTRGGSEDVLEDVELCLSDL